MDARVESLKEVAKSGNIDAFYTLIQDDVNLLEHIDEQPFADTPLHIAACEGKISFAMEMMVLKPSFARKLNSEGYSPIHLALEKGHMELVHQLLQLDVDLVRVKGRMGFTPLHYLVEGKQLKLLDEFLSLCPNSITDVTVQNKTALHIALENQTSKVFQFLVEWLANNSSGNAKFIKKTILNWQNNEGKTVLHILESEDRIFVSEDRISVLRHFLSWANRFMGVSRHNLDTAWDQLQNNNTDNNTEIKDMLRRAGAKPGLSLSTFIFWLRSIVIFWPANFRREIRKVTEERRSMLLVVVALLGTLSFQAVLTPPGGLWQDNGLCIATKAGNSSESVGSSNYPEIIYLSHSNTTLACEHKAGTAIALEDGLFLLFLMCNTALFSISTSLIVLLILNFHIKALFLVLNIILCLSYFYSVWAITDALILTIPLVIGAGLYFVAIQVLSW